MRVVSSLVFSIIILYFIIIFRTHFRHIQMAKLIRGTYFSIIANIIASRRLALQMPDFLIV